MTGDDLAKMLEGVDTRFLVFAGGIAALWLMPSLSGVWGKVKSLLPSFKKPEAEPVDVETLADLESLKLLELLRLKTALLPAQQRESIAKHCDGIEADLKGVPKVEQ